jgi:hypothetical protein
VTDSKCEFSFELAKFVIDYGFQLICLIMPSRELTCERHSCLEIVWDGESFKKFEAFISIVNVTATHKYEVRLERTSPITGHLEYKTFKVEDAIIHAHPQEVDLNSKKQQWTFPEGFTDGNTIEVFGIALTKLSVIHKKSRFVSVSEINPKQFYAPVISRNIEHFRIFPRQDFAFNYFDEVLARRAAADTTPFLLKVFSFESTETGQRRFLVADYDSFLRHYSKDPTNSHHVYEIIRENVPCRAYFDLEYQIEFNTDLDGDSLTATWISLVIWKVFEIFKILLGKKDIIVLDSSTQKKYSKHVILNIPAIRFPGIKTEYDMGDGENSETESTEFLFRNNIAVGSLVNMIINDITTTSHSDDESDKPKDLSREVNIEECVDELNSGCDNENNYDNIKRDDKYDDYRKSNDHGEIIKRDKIISDIGSTENEHQSLQKKSKIVPNFSHELKPKKEYEMLWVNKENGQKTCFVDLGVYTRNRAFRLWNSSKFGKNVPFKIVREDKKKYKGLDTSNIGKLLGNVGPNGAVRAGCVRNFNLQRCFVIPLDIYEGVVVGSGDNTEMERSTSRGDQTIRGKGGNEGGKRKRDSDRYESSTSKGSITAITDYSIGDITDSACHTLNGGSGDLDDSHSTEVHPVDDESSKSNGSALLSRALLSNPFLDLPSDVSSLHSICSLASTAQVTAPAASTSLSCSSSSTSSSSSSSSDKPLSHSFTSPSHVSAAPSVISPIPKTMDQVPHPHEGPPKFPNLDYIFDFPTKSMKYVQYLHLPAIERITRYSGHVGHNGRVQTGVSSSSRSSWRNGEILRSKVYLQRSPFPAVDDFVAKFVTKGGVQGIIGIFCRCGQEMSSHPFIRLFSGDRNQRINALNAPSRWLVAVLNTRSLLQTALHCHPQQVVRKRQKGTQVERHCHRGGFDVPGAHSGLQYISRSPTHT